VIIGYRADDSYFSFAEDFINNTISLKQLSKAMYLGKLGEQVALMSDKSINTLQFIESNTVSHQEYYQKRQIRDLKARQEYANKDNTNTINDLFILDILRKKIKNNDTRLQ
jgi:hypothetical protein